MESENRPNLVESYRELGMRRFLLNINIKQEGILFMWEQVTIPKGRFDYGGIVDALISHKYPIDKMQSVINNYLLDPTDETIVKEFNEMQAWRKEAKEIAKQALEYELH